VVEKDNDLRLTGGVRDPQEHPAQLVTNDKNDK
jgi:hypothetical protein